MIRQSRIIVLCGLCLILVSSCCGEKDSHNWFPDEAVRYYNEHDTVKFYCPESDEYESYVVCDRDTTINIEQYSEGYCDYTVFSYFLTYILSLDSCGSSKSLAVFINAPNPGDLVVYINHPDHDQGVFIASFKESSKFSIDILDNTYHNVIEMPGSEWSEIPSILFSYEYGVIQIQYENQTFSLINNEN